MLIRSQYLAMLFWLPSALPGCALVCHPHLPAGRQAAMTAMNTSMAFSYC